MKSLYSVHVTRGCEKSILVFLFPVHNCLLFSVFVLLYGTKLYCFAFNLLIDLLCNFLKTKIMIIILFLVSTDFFPF
ncbi:hypothetical protein KSF78_0006300 [Schistosoma japonicum]|nr:hypothetical protein KSF78_0006300 [Schistosoma japonicum]